MFTAAKSVPCIRCHGLILAGEPVSWHRGKNAAPGSFHVACPSECPPAVSFVSDDEPAPLDTYNVDVADDDLPPEPEEPMPGTRAWLRTATVEDREGALLDELDVCVTRRNFIRHVVRYSRNLSDRDAARFKRWARGVWDGVTTRLPDVDSERNGFNSAQLSLFPDDGGVTQHSTDTHAWRAIVSEWAQVPA